MDFELLDIGEEINRDFSDSIFPTIVKSWVDKEFSLNHNSTYYGFVFKGEATVYYENQFFTLHEDMYFCVPDKGKVVGKGFGILVERIGVSSIFSIGGKIENKGRLKYIDGCSDTLLISPTILGDPCLNFLHIPKNINQTRHTHPSIRIGLILSGEGLCITPKENYELSEGKIFILHPECQHSFHTADQELRIIVYHPDSDFGPTNNNHPMLNRTIINSVSASKIKEVHTK